MFEALTARPPDAIIALMEQCQADTNPDKIDLGVGVYKNEAGETVIMRSVKKAEQLWWKEETTKTYVGTSGNPEFRRLMLDLILGADNAAITEGRIASAQAAGGSGALSIGAELIAEANPDAVVWVSTPTWANHVPLIGTSGLTIKSYPYYNRETLGVDFDDMMAYLKANAKAGDVLVLHGCCHNPTGADLSSAQWDIVADYMAEAKVLPFVDLAYFGLGGGIEIDTYGLRKVIETNPETVFAASCSKNFALYRERTGMAAVICTSPETAKVTQNRMGLIQRRAISMPPDHGAALVVRVLNDADLRAEWETELTEMRERMISLRAQLSKELRVQGAETMADAVKAQNGMFSTLPLSQAQAEKLRAEHSIYLMNSGRMNIAGANSENIPRFAKAILDVL